MSNVLFKHVATHLIVWSTLLPNNPSTPTRRYSHGTAIAVGYNNDFAVVAADSMGGGKLGPRYDQCKIHIYKKRFVVAVAGLGSLPGKSMAAMLGKRLKTSSPTEQDVEAAITDWRVEVGKELKMFKTKDPQLFSSDEGYRGTEAIVVWFDDQSVIHGVWSSVIDSNPTGEQNLRMETFRTFRPSAGVFWGFRVGSPALDLLRSDVTVATTLFQPGTAKGAQELISGVTLIVEKAQEIDPNTVGGPTDYVELNSHGAKPGIHLKEACKDQLENGV